MRARRRDIHVEALRLGHRQGRYARILCPGQRFERGLLLPKQFSKVDMLKGQGNAIDAEKGGKQGDSHARKAAVVWFWPKADSQLPTGEVRRRTFT